MVFKSENVKLFVLKLLFLVRIKQERKRTGLAKLFNIKRKTLVQTIKPLCVKRR